MDWEQLLALAKPSLPATVGLAVVATFGYLVGRASRRGAQVEVDKARREIDRARAVASELENIANVIHKNLANHKQRVSRFKNRVGQLDVGEDSEHWKRLWQEAEEILQPTQQLAAQIATAYEEIRQQTTHLMAFTEVRTDPLTGVRNRRALDEILDMLSAMHERHGQTFSVAIFDVDHFKDVNDQFGHLTGDRVLQGLARLIEEEIRQSDVLARYGGEEFVVTMPDTSLSEARQLAERLRERVAGDQVADVRVTLSGGVATITDEDDIASLMSRADAALYEAKAAGRDRIRCHDGQSVKAYETPVDAESNALVD